MKFNVITIFPDIIFHYCNETILGRAQEEKIIAVNAVNLRDFTTDKHQKVDDTPYGGGAGMVMKPEPVYRALEHLDALRADFDNQTSDFSQRISVKSKNKNPKSDSRSPKAKRTILLSPRGRQFDQRTAEEWSKLKEMTFVCGRYEGVDQRVADYMVDEEISIGPYVLAGGELGAMIVIEAVSRLLPGVLGNAESLYEETFGGKELKIENWKLKIFKEYPQYTKPADFRSWKVPEVLLSGDHEKIAAWRQERG